MRTTPDGTWELDTQTGDWKEISPDGTEFYEDLSEFLGDYIPGIGYPRFVDWEGLPVSSDHGQYYDFRYAGKTEIDGRAAARYEQVSAHSQVIDVEEGLKMQVEFYEFFEDNPLLFRRSAYLLLPNGELQRHAEIRVEELGLQNCPGT